MDYSLAGRWIVDIGDGATHEADLPGTLDEAGIGYPDLSVKPWHPDVALRDGTDGRAGAGPITSRFTRRVTFTGPARFSRTIETNPHGGRRYFVEVERARHLRLFLGDTEVPASRPQSVSTPHVFEVTGLLTGSEELTFVSDNSYPGWPRESILYSSAATDETQTNWNGLLGRVRLRERSTVFISAIRCYPGARGLRVVVELDAGADYAGTLIVTSEALAAPARVPVAVAAGTVATLELGELPLATDVRRWDEGEGNLYELTAALDGSAGSTAETTSIGVRTFDDDGAGYFALNGRRIFLRSETNCAVFPETGYPPLTIAEWEGVLRGYAAYGVNLVRFHSHCPPAAAFTAADRIGMLMAPELSHWNPVDAFEADHSTDYYRAELRAIQEMLASHPSFVMLTFGNELFAGELGHAQMEALLAQARDFDPTRAYASGSNNHYGALGADPASDFYTTQSHRGLALRGSFAGSSGTIQGHLNIDYPSATPNYDDAIASIRADFAGPVISFEVGQFEVLPDFDELTRFAGVTDPANLRTIRQRVAAAGLTDAWPRYVSASGELSRIAYRAEVEAALRTRGLAGISLLGLQDFPGQGTALVGMLNSHLEPKPFTFADPARFRSFLTSQLPLVLLPRYTFVGGERLVAPVRVANYGRAELGGPVHYELRGTGVEIVGVAGEAAARAGALTEVGTIDVALPDVAEPMRLELDVHVGRLRNHYPLWLYPRSPAPASARPPTGVLEARTVDDEVRAALDAGGVVYLSPPATAQALPNSIQTQFTTDFWSVATFPDQPGGMGQLIDAAHPLFRRFPTETHSNWQWWPMATQRAVVLPAPPAGEAPLEAIVTEMDSYAFLRPLAKLFECRVGAGRLLFSSLGLQDLQDYPEARALQSAVYAYLAGADFAPRQSLELSQVAALVAPS